MDYDNDGRQDLLVFNEGNNGIKANYLYHNIGSGSFTRDLTNLIASNVFSQGTEGGDWGDYDNDGNADLFIADVAGVRNRLYHNLGGGAFTNVNTGPMLIPAAGTQPHVASWFDYDNDGYLDLIVSYADHNSLYRNNHDGTFSEILSIAMAKDKLSGNNFFNTISCVDYDNDGFLDLYVTVGNSGGLRNSQSFLYHNSGNTNGWLKVRLVGTVSNRSAIGAKIRVLATIDGKSVWQMRELKSSGGWDLATPLVAHFGLGDATNAQTLRIEWPSGTVQEFRDVMSKQTLTITEPPRLLASVTNGSPQFSLKGGRGFQYDILASTDLTAWSPVGTVTITNLNGMAQIMDTNTPVPNRKFYRAVSH